MITNLVPSWAKPRTPAFQPVCSGVRAFIHFWAKCSDTTSNEHEGYLMDLVEYEIALISELHHDVGMSYGPPRILLGADTFSVYRGIFVFQFGVYGWTQVLAYGALEDALEDAASVLREKAPGCFSDVALPLGYDDMDEEEQDAAHNEATADLTYTESGYLASHEWACIELHSIPELLAYAYRS